MVACTAFIFERENLNNKKSWEFNFSFFVYANASDILWLTGEQKNQRSGAIQPSI